MILLLLCIIMLVGIVSADITWDNFKTFDDKTGKYGKIEIWDTGQIAPDKKLAEYILEYNTEYCFDCYAIGTAKLYYDGQLFSDLNFKDNFGDRILINSDKIFINSTSNKIVEEFETICEPVIDSKNNSISCIRKVTGSHIEKIESMIEYNGEYIKSGSYKWRIEGKLLRRQQVDWLAESFGEVLDDWAWWNNSFNLRREITGLNHSLPLPVNGSFPITVDDTGEQGWIYGIGNGTANDAYYLYYNNNINNTRIANETTEMYKVQTKPIQSITGSYPGNMTLWLPLDNNFSTAFDASRYSRNGTIGSDIVQNVSQPDSTLPYMFNGYRLRSKGEDNAINVTCGGSNCPFSNGHYGTIVIWLRPADINSVNKNIVVSYGGGGNSAWILQNGDALDVAIGDAGCKPITLAETSGLFAANELMMLSLTWNDVNDTYILYKNDTIFNGDSTAGCTKAGGVFYVGDLVGSGGEPWNGTIYDIKAFNYDLHNTEIATLYAMSTNMTSGSLEAILSSTSILQTPSDNLDTANTSLTFQGSAISTNAGNLSNMTVYVWRSNFTLFKTNTIQVTGQNNATNISISGLDIKNNYSWNILACANNSVEVDCNFASSNRTFDVTMLKLQTFFNPVILEGNEETFILNITIPYNNSLSITKLIYNNTDYIPTITDLGSGSYRLMNIFDVPKVDANTNITFFWNITTNEKIEFITNSSNQSIIALTIDDCSVNPFRLFNLTMRDEGTQDFITTGTNIEVNINIFPIGSNITILNLSTEYNAVNPALVCLSDELNDTVYRLDSTFAYNSSGRVREFYHIQNLSLNNNSMNQKINLFDLATAQSQEFKIIFKDQSFRFVEDALIDITRFYVSDGLFKTVEIGKTDSSGQTIGHLVLTDVIYTIIVTKEGEILATFDNIIAICKDLTIGDCVINLNAFDTGTKPSDFENLQNLSFTMNFDESTRTISSTFTTTDGSVATIGLNSTKFDRFGNNTVCNKELTTSSGTINCIIPESFGNVTVITKLFKNGKVVTTKIFSISEDASDIFGMDGIIYLMLMVIVLPFMFIASTIGMVIAVIIGLIAAALLNIYTGGNIIGAGSTIIWIIVAGGIIIWKISQEGES